MSRVTWDAEVCTHAGKCVAGLPQVFKIEDGSFVINEQAASEEEIKRVAAQCPSGALRYQE
ncbi:(4Fe-4S)-binding protein [Sedimenticola thiotaurini]|uniref:Divergent 4Fe-4S mono-cluster domain-containing protein n=1 Tax=Sedimenticola thiotaurini TaxID=1543721 RepID=A0A0F7JYQ9_9GAMM|nr:(4Fe-4S)-binding protein [Sedimenticola thiotaurini]AKH20424.1 hypothetical protein AAY24_08745 [Sedimenticola thiotaurini]